MRPFGPLEGRAVVEQGAAERLEQVVVLVGNSQHQADGQRRDRKGEVGHEVGRGASVRHSVHGPVDDVLDSGPEFLDALDQEVLGDHAAQPSVFGVVHADEAGLHGRQFPLTRREEREAGGARVGTEAGVGQHGAYLLVAGDEPARRAVRQYGSGDGGVMGGGRVRGGRIERTRPVGAGEVERRGGRGGGHEPGRLLVGGHVASMRVMAPLGHRSAARRTSWAYF